MTMRKHSRFVLAILVLLLGFLPTQQVEASSSAYAGEFAYAMNIDPLGNSLVGVHVQAKNIGPDWLMVDFDWAAWFPSMDTKQSLQSLDMIMQFAQDEGISVCIRILNAPDWAMMGSGPNHAHTLNLIRVLYERYPGSMKAVELFPGANTTQGWGATPSPQAYMDLLDEVQQSFILEEMYLLLVAGGLVAVDSPDQVMNVSDISFLEGLYTAGFRSLNAILSVQMTDLHPDLFHTPQSMDEPALLHIDAVQNVMTLNDDEAGIVWVTALSFKEPVSSLYDACNLLRSRLFVGLISPAALNPIGSVPAVIDVSDGNGEAETMQQLISENHSQTNSPFGIRSKNLQSISKDEQYESNPVRAFFSCVFGFGRSWISDSP